MEEFQNLTSRIPGLRDEEAKFELIKGLKPEIQIHMIGQHHVDSLEAALEEFRIHGHARRGAHTTGRREDRDGYPHSFGSIYHSPMELGTMHRGQQINAQRSGTRQKNQQPTPMEEDEYPNDHRQFHVHKTEEETIALGLRSLEIDRDRLQEWPRQIRDVTIMVTWVTLPRLPKEGQNVAVILELKRRGTGQGENPYGRSSQGNGRGARNC